MRAGWKKNPLERMYRELKLEYLKSRTAKARADALQAEALDAYAAQLIDEAAKRVDPRKPRH